LSHYVDENEIDKIIRRPSDITPYLLNHFKENEKSENQIQVNNE